MNNENEFLRVLKTTTAPFELIRDFFQRGGTVKVIPAKVGRADTPVSMRERIKREVALHTPKAAIA